MTRGIPTALNDAGVAHVAGELKRLGLDWSVSGTCGEIEDKPGFLDLKPGLGEIYEYEISNTMAGKSSYGAHGWIGIEADLHVTFVEPDE